MRLAEQSITLGGHDVPSLAANRRVWLLDTNVTQKNLGPPIELVGGETASNRLQTLFVFWFFVAPKLLQLRMAIVPDLNIPQALQWKHRIRIKELVHFAGPKQNFLRLHNGKWSGGCNR